MATSDRPGARIPSPGVPASGADRTRQPDARGPFTRQFVMSQVDQRIAAVAHLSIGFGVIIGVGFLVGLAINLVIWLRSRRSPVVELHAEQAGAYQLVVLLTNIVLVSLWIAAAVIIIGNVRIGPDFLRLGQVVTGFWCVLTPLTALWYFGTIAYGVYAGLVVGAGRDFSYPIFGPWARRRLAARAR